MSWPVPPDPEYIATHPNAVREWCINAAAVDPFNKAILVNSEDGKSYCWNLVTNTLEDIITLTPGVKLIHQPSLVRMELVMPLTMEYYLPWELLLFRSHHQSHC
ncbi:MAG: hypothetical protein U0930_13735 [Pirellulales bacterium]